MDPVREALASYWESLKAAISDLEITEEEKLQLAQERQALDLKPEQLRALHAKIFGGLISQFTSDKWLDDREARVLRKAWYCLSDLGWAPGQ